MLRIVAVALLVFAVLPSILPAAEPPAARVTFTRNADSLLIKIDGQPIGEYVTSYEQIARPFMRNLRTLNGRQVTRNSPPKQDDLDDHPTMHPGLWLAFGDLGGADFWRNKARVKHAGIINAPQDGLGSGSFSVRNSYEADGKSICTEQCSIKISVVKNGYLLDWTSIFRSQNSDLAFGDQEEMGLGVRVATPLAVVKGGQIIDSQGRRNGKEVWGQQSDWCRYGGSVDGHQIGVVLMPDPKNFRPSWFHARDYGVLVANPFGQNAFTKGEKSKIVVPQGDSLQLRFGVLVYDVPAESSLSVSSAYANFVSTTQQSP